MSTPASYGPAPWRQSFWDGRAAANFTCGGLGAGLVVAAALSGLGGLALAVPLLVGLAVVACGLACVFAELGRPLRAANVVRNPRTSWMAREALVAPLLFACGVAAVFVHPAFAWPAALLAAAFAYCQGRMIQAARGIPAWRSAQTPWLFVATALAEGCGAWLALAPFLGASSARVGAALAAAVVVRFAVLARYRQAVRDGAPADAQRALDRAGRTVLHVGTLAALALLVVAAAASPYPWARWIAALAGVAAAGSGVAMKLAILRGAAYTQGVRLPHLPVRGTRA
ncbi:MAG TPA: DmsC/YnfH family molybdoenzyme membrane anchor subunit [Casimicrobiaceae bacterium]|nr:DmsC/YnfH family molybdoenzyme membrane anchor subunit [Casimicrobiaceae bacterium]